MSNINTGINIDNINPCKWSLLKCPETQVFKYSNMIVRELVVNDLFLFPQLQRKLQCTTSVLTSNLWVCELQVTQHFGIFCGTTSRSNSHHFLGWLQIKLVSTPLRGSDAVPGYHICSPHIAKEKTRKIYHGVVNQYYRAYLIKLHLQCVKI